jgi:hypothetical protein
MIVSVFGRTDRRPVIYTLLKIFQTLGTETVLLSDNYHYSRLTQDGTLYGSLQSVDIFIDNLLADEVFQMLGRKPSEWDNIIADNKDFPNADVVFYTEGLGIEETDKDLLLTLRDEYTTIKLGKSVFPTLEVIEYTKNLQQVDKKLTEQIVKVLAPKLNIPAQQILKGVCVH